MLHMFPPFVRLAVVVGTVTLTGCMTCLDPQHMQHHRGTTTSQTDGAMPDEPSDKLLPWRDMKVMCEEHRKLSEAKAPEERRAIMDRDMKAMTPDTMVEHVWTMEDLCKRN